jgi:hypothetical protein
MVPPANLDALSHAELKNLVALFEQLAELQRTNVALPDAWPGAAEYQAEQHGSATISLSSRASRYPSATI